MDLSDDERLADEADQALRQARSRRTQVRLTAVQSLAGLPAETAIPELLRLLGDAREGVQAAAAEALRTLPDLAGHAALVAALNDRREYARLMAARSLARERRPDARVVLEAALLDADVDKAGPAMEGLIMFGGEARVTIERALGDRHESSFLREMAARGLAAIGDPAALPALRVAATDADGSVARSARSALKRLAQSDAAGSQG